MTDAIYWDNHEELMIKLEREPTYEEVQKYVEDKFKITAQQEKEFMRRNIYGK